MILVILFGMIGFGLVINMIICGHNWCEAAKHPNRKRNYWFFTPDK